MIGGRTGVQSQRECHSWSTSHVGCASGSKDFLGLVVGVGCTGCAGCAGYLESGEDVVSTEPTPSTG